MSDMHNEVMRRLGRPNVPDLQAALAEARADLDEARAEVERLRAVADTLSSRATAAECALSHRIALRREIEAALGIETGMTDDEALATGLEAIQRLRAEADEWAMRADGVVHNPHCTDDLPCLRCRAEQAEREHDEARALLRECRPWVSRGLMDHPAPTTDDWAVLARLDDLLGDRDGGSRNTVAHRLCHSCATCGEFVRDSDDHGYCAVQALGVRPAMCCPHWRPLGGRDA